MRLNTSPLLPPRATAGPRYEDENIWITQKMMAQLYDVTVPAINQHIKRVLADSELNADSVIKKHLITAVDGKQYNTNHYSLQMIIAVGFKVKYHDVDSYQSLLNIMGSIWREEERR